MGLIDRLSGRSKGAKPIPVTKDNFNDLLSSSKYVIVDFWGKNCPPCDAMHPIVGKLTREYEGEILFLKVNVSHQPEIAERYRVKSVPAFLLFENGRLRDRRVGAMQYDVFKKWIEKFTRSD